MTAPKVAQAPSSMVCVAVEPDGVHNALKGFNHWVVWKAEPKENGDGFDKVPYSPCTAQNASTTDSTTWASFEDAVAAYVREGWDGIGFVLSSGDPFTFVDLDHCRNPETGAIDKWAEEWIARFGGHTEVSPSGTGIHIIIQGKSPHNGKKTVEGKKVEVYSRERFATMTGVRP